MTAKKIEPDKKMWTLLSLLKAKDLGIKEIRINFSGSGDSGDIDDVEFVTFNGDHVYPKDINKEIFIDLAWDVISEKVDPIGDWVNNDGGYGHISICAETGKYSLEYSQRTTEEYDWDDCNLFI